MSPVRKARLLAAACIVATGWPATGPVLAQQMGYETDVYGGVQAPPPQEPQPVYVRQPVVQEVPDDAPQAYDGEYDTFDSPVADEDPTDPEYVHPDTGYLPGPDYASPPYGEPSYARPAPPPPYPAYPYYQAYPQQSYAGVGYPPMPPVLDRDEWLAECRAYLSERRRRGDDGAVTGGLLGAAAGGLIGNRLADGERLGGTLIGAGVGGLVGLFIGQAIALGGDGGRSRDCKDWLRAYEDSLAGGGHWPAQAYHPYPGPMWGGWDGRWHQIGPWQSRWSSGGWSGWWSGYVVLPVTTVVVTESQRMVPVVREVVRERWIEEEQVSYRELPPPKAKVKQRVIKTKTKAVRYTKGK